MDLEQTFAEFRRDGSSEFAGCCRRASCVRFSTTRN